MAWATLRVNASRRRDEQQPDEAQTSHAAHLTGGRKGYPASMRVLGIDYGARRVGLALSDATGTLASPWRLVERPPSEAETLRLLADIVERLRREEEGLAAVVVGWPRRLDGSPTHQTALVEAFSRALEQRVGLRVVLQDERLSSHAANERLAERGERDWRVRKRKLDAAAAAVVLQDFLDTRTAGTCGS